MSAADETRAEAEQRWPLPEFAPWEELLFSQRDVDSKSSQAFVAGAEWQASRDSAELTRLYAINEELAGQVQAAQATIAEAIAEGELVQEQFQQGDSLNSVIDILSRSDMSALAEHDEALIRQHTQTILDATREATVRAIADAEVRGYRRKVDERITSTLAASIEQTEADRG